MQNIFDLTMKVNAKSGSEEGKLVVCTRELLEKVMDDPNNVATTHKVTELNKKMRASNDEKERGRLHSEAGDLKLHLPALMLHGHSLDGSHKKTSMVPSPWVHLDLDKLDDARGLWSEKIEPLLKDIPHPLVYVTPSGYGLKITLPMPRGIDERGTAQRLYAQILGVDYDASTCDISRCCFAPIRENLLTYQPDLLFAPEVEPFALPDISIPAAEAPDNVLPTPDSTATPTDVSEAEPCYRGIPYSRIISVYWEVNNQGRTPIEGERESLTNQLAYDLLTIAGKDFDLLNRVIPCYDNFPQKEKEKAIRDAFAGASRRIPWSIRKTLKKIEDEDNDSDSYNMEEEFDEQCFQDICAAFKKQSAHIPYMPKEDEKKLPVGMRETLADIPPKLAMPGMMSMGPLIGTLASELRLDVHGDVRALSLQCFVVGDAASGKSNFNKIYKLWMYYWNAEQEALMMKDQQNAKTRKSLENAREQPVIDDVPLLLIAGRISSAKLLDRLMWANGMMCLSFLTEADESTANGGQTWTADVSVIARKAYDGDPYVSDTRSNDTGIVYVKNVRWNIFRTGTPDSLYQTFTNYTNGSLNRTMICRLPDNVWDHMNRPPKLSEELVERIHGIAKLIPLLKGEVVLDQLEATGCKWVDLFCDKAKEANDRPRAKMRFRIPVNAQRITCALMIPQLIYWLQCQLDNHTGDLPEWAGGCQTAEEYLKAHHEAAGLWLPKMQTKAWCKTMEVICDYLFDNLDYYFSDRIAQALNSSNYSPKHRGRPNVNDAYLTTLPEVFEMEMLSAKMGKNKSNAASCTIQHWLKAGKIEPTGKQGQYIKCKPATK